MQSGNKNLLRTSILLRLLAAILLFLADSNHPYSYYQLLRFVVVAACVTSLIAYIPTKKVWLGVFFAPVAALYNPVILIHLSKGTWDHVDIIVCLLLLFTLSGDGDEVDGMIKDTKNFFNKS